MARKPNPAPTTGQRPRVRPSRRIAAIGLLGTGLYATGLYATGLPAADAQAPVATVSPTATPTPTPLPPAATPIPTPEPPAATPIPTPEPPAATPSPTPTPEPPTPAPTSTPAPPEATPTPEATTTPAAPEPAPSNTRPASPDADESGDRTSRRHRRPHDKTGKGERRRNPAPARRKHAPGRPADRPTRADRAPVAPADSVAVAAPVGAPLAGPFAPISVPGFFIDEFRIPPFLLPIYQAAGMQYGVRWEVLAAINEIETDYGRNLNVSSAGATGWMQFMPATWADYGVDANRDGRKDPNNPVDAIFAAGRYLRAAGADRDIRQALFAYNHADWYVDSVLRRARLIGGLPSDLVNSLTGLAQGRLPVRAPARNAVSVQGRGIEIAARSGAPVIAVNDGRIVRIGRSSRLGLHVQLRDVYGNTYTYAGLGQVASAHPAADQGSSGARVPWLTGPPAGGLDAPRVSEPVKQRLFANPTRPGPQAVIERNAPRPVATDSNPKAMPIKKGARVIAGTTLGRLAESAGGSAHMRFEIRPAGRGAPSIDPKPILKGWKLLEESAATPASGHNAAFKASTGKLSIGQLMLLSKDALARRVLANPRIEIYDCGRDDIRSGRIDRRALATMLYLAASGLAPTISSLECGHGTLTTSGNVSEHSTGTAMDIAAINGITITPGTQGADSITEQTIKRLLALQGTMKPHQIISLMTFDGADNTLAMGDHDDHIHVGWQPGTGAGSRTFEAVLKPSQWTTLIDRLARIDNPEIPAPSSRDRETVPSTVDGADR